MPKRIRLVQQRLVLSRLVLRLVQLCSLAYIGDELFGSEACDVMLLLAVFVGHAEGRPMTAAKLAEYVGIPRPTVARKLREMKSCGLVELDEHGAAACALERLNAPAMVSAIEAGIQAIHRAAAELSKMDAMPIARSDER